RVGDVLVDSRFRLNAYARNPLVSRQLPGAVYFPEVEGQVLVRGLAVQALERQESDLGPPRGEVEVVDPAQLKAQGLALTEVANQGIGELVPVQAVVQQPGIEKRQQVRFDQGGALRINHGG